MQNNRPNPFEELVRQLKQAVEEQRLYRAEQLLAALQAFFIQDATAKAIAMKGLLHIAGRKNNPSMVKFLLEHGADRAELSEGETPIVAAAKSAVESGSWDAVEVFLNYKTDAEDTYKYKDAFEIMKTSPYYQSNHVVDLLKKRQLDNMEKKFQHANKLTFNDLQHHFIQSLQRYCNGCTFLFFPIPGKHGERAASFIRAAKKCDNPEKIVALIKEQMDLFDNRNLGDNTSTEKYKMQTKNKKDELYDILKKFLVEFE